MKRGLIFIILFSALMVFSISSISALTFSAEKINNVVAQEASIPAKFNLTLMNPSNIDDYVELYTLVDVMLSPKGSVKVAPGETKTVTLEVFPSDKLKRDRRGVYTFVYYVKSSIDGIKEDRLVIKLLPLKDIIEIELPEAINFDTFVIPVTFRNNESIVLEDISVKLSAPFISGEQSFSLNPLEERKVDINVDNTKLRTLVAGKYIATFSFIVNDEASFKLEKEITVSEKSNIETTEEDAGNWLYPIKIITKTNKGNTISVAEIIESKGFLGKYLTSFSIQPSSLDKGALNTYKWNIQLKPGESVRLEIKTNYIFVFLIILAVIIVALLLILSRKQSVVLKKKVLRVKTKGGEFAFKSVVIIKAKEEVTDVVIRDRLPKLTELHERFGTEKPTKIDTQKKMLEWHLPEMKKGQEHVFSYIAYSRISVLGTFEIPKAHVTFSHKGKTKTVLSNSTFLLTEEHSI